MNFIDGGVAAPIGFTTNGILSGIKAGRTRPDTALIFSEKPCAAAGVFTKNKVQAECVKLSRRHVAGGSAQAVIVNSGNANACTGEQGAQAARRMAKAAASQLHLQETDVLVCSTGVIGQQLPVEKIEAKMADLVGGLSKEGHQLAREAIMTTDTRYKEAAVETVIGGKTVRLGTMAKGSGMIHINMGTMLGFITTDVNIDNKALQAAFKANIDDSFNMVSVDGDTSTNDMVVILANGQAGNEVLTEESADFPVFKQALREICIAMAQKIAGDGEGATKLVECTVTGAATMQDARLAAKAIIASSLVKTAIYGNDANWGRIACAAGYSGAKFDPNKVNIFIGDVQVAQNGMGLEFDEAKATEILKQKKVNILVKFNIGDAQATAWGCDLTYDYVSINADYRS